MKNNAIWGVVIIIIVAGLVLLNANNTADTKQSIKVGAALSLSGNASVDGESIKNGLELARKDLAKKGINVEIIYQDDKTDPKGTVSAIHALKAQGVEAIIGPTWSYLADAGVPVANQVGMVTMQPANTTEYVSAGDGKYAFFSGIKVASAVDPMTEWLKKNNVKTIALIANEGAWYETVSNMVRASAKEAGAEIVYYETVPFGVDGATMATIVTKAKASNPDLVFAELDDTGAIFAMLKKTQELQFATPLMSVTPNTRKVLVENASLSLPNKISIISPVMDKEFASKYKKEYGKELPAYADRSYDTLMILTDAILNKGDVPLEKYIRDNTNYKGYAGTYVFDAKGDVEGGDWVVQVVQ